MRAVAGAVLLVICADPGRGAPRRRLNASALRLDQRPGQRFSAGQPTQGRPNRAGRRMNSPAEMRRLLGACDRDAGRGHGGPLRDRQRAGQPAGLRHRLPDARVGWKRAALSTASTGSSRCWMRSAARACRPAGAHARQLTLKPCEERARIARELHDIVAHAVTATNSFATCGPPARVTASSSAGAHTCSTSTADVEARGA
jgi:signal transduction histidine kinase